MKRYKSSSCLLRVLFFILFSAFALVAFAHPGRTDSAGGHTNHSTGEYHYHHGYSAHSHEDLDGDGILDCPYNFVDKTDHSAKGNGSTSKPTQDFIETEREAPALTSRPVKEKDVQKSKTLSFDEVFAALAIAILPAIVCGGFIADFITDFINRILSIFSHSDLGDNAFVILWWISTLATDVVLAFIFIYLFH